MRIPSIDAVPPKLDDEVTGRRLGDGEAAVPQGAGSLMPNRDFALALERLGNGAAVLVLAGELDLYRAPDIEHALAQAIEPERDRDRRGRTYRTLSADGGQSDDEEVPRLTVDLRSVTFLDSTTLEALLAASRRQHARGGELVVLVGSQTPTTIFEVTGFDHLLAIRRVDAGPRPTAA
jgi:anti-anti-sigma regulatory factor